ncbi:hypothetical protein Ga0100231_023760 [Opitutaceae bacterium TAV4]|nr:hypothetical protein Ga0100231_023760 [Opitutaceae bacterium TAV4]RRK00892.1 hypothetical protein Ga0100230_024270 [Opitutaceae bacterium TAV3]
MKTKTCQKGKGKRFRAGKAGYRYTEASYARLCQGRPAKYPEAKILAERFGVTITHAIHVCAGRRVSHYLTAQLPAIRAELAARKEEV